jgi:hypothetical protein
MTSRAGIVLVSALQSPGVVGAALVDSTSFVIGTASPGEGDLASSGAAAVEKLRQWTVLGTVLALGTPKSLMFEREGSQTPSPPRVRSSSSTRPRSAQSTVLSQGDSATAVF